MKKFMRQIKFEIKNILRSKFLLIIGILVIVSGIVLPVISFFEQRIDRGGTIRPMPMPIDRVYYASSTMDKIGIPGYPGEFNQDPITIDGVTIQPDNPFYWSINSLTQEKDIIENDKQRFSSPEVLDLNLSMIDAELKYYVRFSSHITSHMDYRAELAWRGLENIYDKFLYEHNDVQEDFLIEAFSYRRGIDPEVFKTKYIEITPEQRLAALDEVDETLNTLFIIVETNDFPKYIDLRIQQENKTIESIQEQITNQEKEIIKNPSQEEYISQYIEEMKREIKRIETSRIPILLLRLERNIIPGEATWQNNALSDIESSQQQLTHTEIMSEEKFYQEMWLVQQHGTYAKYVNSVQMQIDELNNTILVGERSIYGDKPDMKYVYNGARNKTVQFLSYSVFVALFAVLLGGWLMASEFQQGTIRLLMIRPKTRMKILMAKYLAAFIICLIIYAAGSLLNMVANGALFGFGDYLYPNYTISGEINFFAYYLPKLLACMIPIIFAYTVAFMLSVLIKNTAVSIALPIAGFIGSSIVMSAFSYRGTVNWMAYTPIPYVQMSSFFVQYSSVHQLIRRGVPLNLTYGIMLLLVLSGMCTVLSIFVFKKRDITN